MNFWLSLIYIGLLLTNGYEQKIKILNISKCSTPARDVIATPTVQRGENVKRGFYPWHSSIFKLDDSFSKYICGGTLISVGTVLTAAHCLHEERGERLLPIAVVVRLDVNRLYFDGETYSVQYLIPHEHYNDNNFHHDIALIKLRTQVKFNDYIRPACLTNYNFNIFDVVGYVVGFGESAVLNKTSMPGRLLNEGSMPGRSYKDCKLNNQVFYDNYVIPEFSFCAGNINGTTISKGDSGGGLVFKYLDVIYVRGIVSLAPTSGASSNIDVTKFLMLTDVQSHYDWIVKNLQSYELDESEAHTNVSLRNNDPVGLPLNSDGLSRKGYYPWHVAIYNDQKIAGGTIITDDIILTTSFIANWNNLIVEVQGQIFTVKTTKNYDDIDKDTIFLLKLRESIVFTNIVRPASLINKDIEFKTINPVWIPSYTRNNNKLNVNDVKIFKSNLLNYSDEDSSPETENYINIGTGLIVELENGYYLVGFTTFPYSFSGIVELRFITYSYYYDWIQTTIKELN